MSGVSFNLVSFQVEFINNLESIRKVREIIEAHPELVSLGLSMHAPDDNISTESIKNELSEILNVLSKFNYFRHLLISGVGRDSLVDIAVLINFLQKTPILETLRLQSTNLGNAGVIEIADALNENNHLIHLDLSDNQIEVEGVKAIADALKKNNQLTHLDLSRNQIEVEGAMAIINALKKNNQLTQLYLSYNQIEVEGAKAIANALKKYNQLTHLDLSGNQIEVEGAKANQLLMH